MDVTVFTEPVTFCIIKNYYNADELELLGPELEKLKSQLKGPEHTGTAHNILGGRKKDNHGLFLDNNHPIAVLNQKCLKPEFIHDLTKENWFFTYLKHCNNSSTLVSYYEDSGHYKSHTDSSIVTAIHYFWKEPKMFTGGDLYFGDFRVPIENNCLLIFPSCTEHEVSKLTGSGRYAITQFISKIEPQPQRQELVHRFHDFLNITEFNKVKSIIENGKWSAGGASGNPTSDVKFLYMDLQHEQLLREVLLRKIEMVTNKKFNLDRVYANGQWHALDGSWHQDNTQEKTWTFIVYMNEIEPADLDKFGGCTDFKEDETTNKSYKPVPNSALLFPSWLFHRGSGPSRFFTNMRITVAWKLSEKNSCSS
jgi:predicted 2-oxoglutarate/Fe(II)-dependent dioxygenase YbiX